MPTSSVFVETVNLHSAVHATSLLALLDHYARDPMGGGKPLAEETKERLIASLQGRSDFFALLAFEGGRALGLVNCFEGFSTFLAKPLLNIHDLVVRSEARGRGIGRLLLQGVEDEARARGCCKLTLEVLSLNQAALHSYQHFGFAAYQLDPNAGQALFLEKKLT